MSHNNFDVIIVGGAVMGSSTAYHLLSMDPNLNIAVIERDPGYVRASTSLCLGGVRVQFSLKENILISLYARQFFSRCEEEMEVGGEKPVINFRREGYLFLIDLEGKEASEKDLGLQNSLGGNVEWWTPERIKKEFPLISAEGFAGGTFGAGDGYVDPYGLMMGFRKKAVSLGAHYLFEEALQLVRSGKGVKGVRLASGEFLSAPVVVNAAGPWAADICRTAGVDLPLLPTKRQVFVVKPEFSFERPLPLIITPSGLYFRSETGGLVLVGRSMEKDPVGFDWSWDWERFTECLWPELVKVIPAFERLKMIRGWAGLYEVNRFDSNALLGAWPGVDGLYLINGFSGHGLQQSPAAGRYVSEVILGRTPTLDLGCFHPARILEDRPLGEGAVV